MSHLRPDSVPVDSIVIPPTLASLYHPRFSVDSVVISPTGASLYRPHFRPAEPLFTRLCKTVTRARLLTLLKSLTQKGRGTLRVPPPSAAPPHEQVPAVFGVVGGRKLPQRSATHPSTQIAFLGMSEKGQKRFGRKGGVQPFREFSDGVARSGRQPMRASAKTGRGGSYSARSTLGSPMVSAFEKFPLETCEVLLSGSTR